MATYNANAGVSQGTKSDQDLWAGMQQHLNDPAALAKYVQANGLSRQATSQVLAANGQDPGAIQSYMDQNKGFDPWGGSYGPGWAGKDLSFASAGGGSAMSNDQIKSYIQQQGIQNDPNAIYKAAKQYGVSGAQIDQTMGYGQGTSDAWVKQQGLNGLFNSGAPQSGQVTMPGGSPPANNMGPVQNPYQPQASVQPPAAQPMVAPTAPTQTAATGSISNPYQQPQGGFGGTSWNGSSYGQNPYTGWQAGAMTQQVSDMLTRSALPAINNQAMASGGVGGSRQGVAQGMAIGDAAKGLSSGLAGLYSGNYAQDQGFGLQSDRLNLDVYNANQNWMNQGQNNQINYMDKLMGWNQQGLQNAATQQNTPLNYAQAFGGMANAAGGQGTSQTNQGNPWLGALGGYMTGSKMFGG